jgi:hypothetical protein
VNHPRGRAETHRILSQFETHQAVQFSPSRWTNQQDYRTAKSDHGTAARKFLAKKSFSAASRLWLAGAVYAYHPLHLAKHLRREHRQRTDAVNSQIESGESPRGCGSTAGGKTATQGARNDQPERVEKGDETASPKGSGSSILAEWFRQHQRPCRCSGLPFQSVWLSDVALDCNEGAW